VIKKNTTVGALGLFTGGTPPQPTTSLRIAKSVYVDNMPWLINQLNRKMTLRAQAEVQIMGDSEQRSCHMFTYRHRHTTTTMPANRVLKPYNNSGVWYPKVDGTVVGQMGIYALDLNQGGSNQAYYNGKCFYAPFNVADLENQSFQLMTPFFHASNVVTGNVNSVDTPNMENWQQGNLAAVSGYYALHTADGNPYNNELAKTYNRPIVSPTIVDGGVKLTFSNKGPSGAFIEVLVVKKKQTLEGTIPTSNTANGSDEPMNSYVTALGRGQKQKACNTQGVVYLDTDAISETAVIQSPYHKLLPDSKYARKQDVDFSQKERFKFALPSSAKKTVNLNFGGFNGIGDQISEVFCPDTVSVIIAVNGQIQSAEITKNGDNLVTGNICSPHNVMCMLDYHETVQAAKQAMPSTKAYINGDVRPELKTGNWPTGISAHPFQMIAAEKVFREGQTNGRRQHAQDGDTAMDEL